MFRGPPDLLGSGDCPIMFPDSPDLFGSGDCPIMFLIWHNFAVWPELRGLELPKTAVAIGLLHRGDCVF
jgi:hypothetical protein